MKQFIKQFLGNLGNNSGGISTITALIPVASFFWTVANDLSEKPTKQPLIVFFISLIFFFAIVLFSFVRTRSVSSYISKQYYDLLHDYRNDMCEIELLCTDKKLSQEKQNLLTAKVKSLNSKFLNHLVDTFKYITKDETISACIKLIDCVDSNKKQTPNNSYISTFMRDSHCSAKRRALDERPESKTLIEKNTAFKYFFEVIDPVEFNTSIFYKSDLLKYDEELKAEGKKYENTTPNWSDYYKSTAIVPIRIKTERLIPNHTGNSYTVLGFLCIDSENTGVFVDSKKEFFANILKSYAALLFQVLNYYNKELNKSQSGKKQIK